MRQVEFITRDPCPLCDEARPVLETWAGRLGIEVVERDVDADAELLAAYGNLVPVARTPDGIVIAKGRWSTAGLLAGLLKARVST